MEQLGIHFGAMADNIQVQLSSKGMKIENVAMYQRQADSITRLALAEIATDSEATSMRKRLLKRICNNVEPM